jgi:hypothetical protein
MLLIRNGLVAPSQVLKTVTPGTATDSCHPGSNSIILGVINFVSVFVVIHGQVRTRSESERRQTCK